MTIAFSKSRASAAFFISASSSTMRLGISCFGICFVSLISICFALIGFLIGLGFMPCFSLNAICSSLLLFVSEIAALMEPVRVSAYKTTLLPTLRAALPMVCTRLLSFLRNPSLSASRIPINPTSGISRPSLRRLIPTRTSNSPRRSCLMSSVRSRVSMSECRYLVLMPEPARNSLNSSASFLVIVVTRIRLPLAIASSISLLRSSICPFVPRTKTSGSTSPVGRMICSTRACDIFSS